MTTEAPPASPFRARLDELASSLIAGALATQDPATRRWIQVAMAQLGWDSAAICSSGPLAGVSDEALATLADALSAEIDGILADHGGLAPVVPADALADALAELRAAIGAQD